MLFSIPNIYFKSLSNDFLLYNLHYISRQIKGVLGLIELSINAPICQNPKPGLMNALFKHWSDVGLSAIKDLYIDVASD